MKDIQDIKKEIEHFETTDWYRSSDSEELDYDGLGRYVSDLVNRLQIDKNTKVLEIACGAGGLGAMLVLQTNCDYTGLDLVPSLFNKAKERFASLGIKGHFINADAQKIPFKKNSFDVVIVSYSLHHFPRNSLDQVTKEVFRVLKKGGSYYALEPNGLNPLVFKWWLFNSPERIFPIGKKWRENRDLSINETILYPWQVIRSFKLFFPKCQTFSFGYFPVNKSFFKRNRILFNAISNLITKIPLLNMTGASFIVIGKK